MRPLTFVLSPGEEEEKLKTDEESKKSAEGARDLFGL